MSRGRLGVWLVGGALALGVASLLAAFREPGAPMDEGLLLVYPALARGGATSGVDFLYPYGPGSLWVLDAIYRAFGTSVVVERSVGFAYRVVLVAALAALARGRSPLRALTAATLAVVVLTPIGLAATAWFGGLACLMTSLALTYSYDAANDATASNASSAAVFARARSSSIGPWTPTLGGLAAAAALTQRPDFALACVVGVAPYFVLADGRARKRWLDGICVGLVPLASFIARAPRAIAHSMLVEPATRARAHLLPIPPLAHDERALFVLVVAVAVANLVVAIASARRRTRLDLDGARGLARGLVSVVLLPQMFQRADLWHVVYVGCVVLACGVPTASAWVRARRFGRGSAEGDEGGIVLAIAVVSAGAMTFAGAISTRLAALVARTQPAAVAAGNGRSFPLGDRATSDEIGAMLSLLEHHAQPGDRLFVGAADALRMNLNDTFVYYLEPTLRPSTYYVAIVPGTSVPVADVARADFVLLSKRYDDVADDAPSTDERRALNVLLATSFCPLGERGRYALRERCARQHRATEISGTARP